MTTSTTKQMTKVVLLFAAICLVINPAMAATLQFERYPAVSQDHLDTMRGGFVTKNDLVINVGVKTASFVDGVLKVVNSWNIPDITRFKGRSGSFVTGDTTVYRNSTPSKVASGRETTSPIQNAADPTMAIQSVESQAQDIPDQGSHSVEVPADFGSSFVVDGTVIRNSEHGTLIQNGVDNKTIQNLTVIEANVMNSGMIREVHLLMSIHEQMMNAMK
jgi:hypothetical protein